MQHHQEKHLAQINKSLWSSFLPLWSPRLTAVILHSIPVPYDTKTKVPWAENPDLPKPHCLQPAACQNTALQALSAARILNF